MTTAGWTATGTTGASQTEVVEGRSAKTGMPATVVMLSTVTALAVAPISAEMPLTLRMPKNHEFSRKIRENNFRKEKNTGKRHKKSTKLPFFCPIAK